MKFGPYVFCHAIFCFYFWRNQKRREKEMGADISIENDTRDEWLIKMTAPTPKGIKRSRGKDKGLIKKRSSQSFLPVTVVLGQNKKKEEVPAQIPRFNSSAGLSPELLLTSLPSSSSAALPPLLGSRSPPQSPSQSPSPSPSSQSLTPTPPLSPFSSPESLPIPLSPTSLISNPSTPPPTTSSLISTPSTPPPTTSSLMSTPSTPTRSPNQPLRPPRTLKIPPSDNSSTSVHTSSFFFTDNSTTTTQKESSTVTGSDDEDYIDDDEDDETYFDKLVRARGYIRILPGESHRFGHYTLSCPKQAHCIRERYRNGFFRQKEELVTIEKIYAQPLFSGHMKNSANIYKISGIYQRFPMYEKPTKVICST